MKVVDMVIDIGYSSSIQVGIGIKSKFIQASKGLCDTMDFFNGI